MLGRFFLLAFPKVRYQFTLGNFTKRTSQFSNGQRPVAFSLLQNTLRLLRRREQQQQQPPLPPQQQHLPADYDVVDDFDTSPTPPDAWHRVGECVQYARVRAFACVVKAAAAAVLLIPAAREE
jgi:hypothetical protein